MSWEQEIVLEGFSALSARAGLLGLLLVGALALAGLEWGLRRRWPRALWALWGLAASAALGLGLVRAWRERWLCDDAFITFRYAHHFSRGDGLVFNVGEWVEGYTNFLWAVGLGWVARLGGDIPQAGLFGNLAAFALAALGAGAAVRQGLRSVEGAAAGVPYALVVVSGSLACVTFATSGLETMPAASLVVLSLWAAARFELPVLSSLLLVGATLCRPDHLLYGVAMGAAVVAEAWWRRRRLPLREALEFAAPFLLIFLPYWLWRWRAYGDFYPNTYYAKSGGSPYVEQGLVYATHFLTASGFWFALPVVALLFSSKPETTADFRLRVFAGLSVLLLGTYVVRVGGDFMEYRFLVALVPVVAVAAEVALRTRWLRAGPRGPKPWWATGLALLACSLTLLPLELIKPGEKRWNLAKEPSFYRLLSARPAVVDSPWYGMALALRRAFPPDGVQPRFAAGCVGMLGYYSTVPFIDIFGLTTRSIAHKPLAQRGRPGHEKHATRDELIAEGAILSTDPEWDEWSPQTQVLLPGATLYFVQFEPRTAEAIVQAGGRVQAPQPELDRLLLARRAEAEEGLAFFERYLALAPERDALLAPLRARLRPIEGFEAGAGALALTGSFAIREGAVPDGFSGMRWLASTGVGEATLSFEARDSGAVRFSLLGSPLGAAGALLECEDAPGHWAVLGEVPAQSAQRPTTAALTLTERAGRCRLTFFDRDARPGLELAVDSVRLAAPDEPQRLAQVDALSGAAFLSSLRLWESELEPQHPKLAQWQARLDRRIDFDARELPPDAMVEGTAFGAPLPGALPNQHAVRGARGARFLNGFAAGDDATGSLEVPLRVSGHVVVNLLTGGSADCGTVFAGLKVGDAVVARSCGVNDEVLRPATLEADVPHGASVSLVFVDRAGGAWAHLLADDVMVWSSGGGGH